MKTRFVASVASLLFSVGGWAPLAMADEPAAAALPTVSPAELRRQLDSDKSDVVVLDVRTVAEFSAGHVPGARNIPHDEIGARLAELSSLRERKLVLYCRSGRRVALAAEALRQAGFTQLWHLEGDYPAWAAQPADGKK